MFLSIPNSYFKIPMCFVAWLCLLYTSIWISYIIHKSTLTYKQTYTHITVHWHTPYWHTHTRTHTHFDRDAYAYNTHPHVVSKYNYCHSRVRTIDNPLLWMCMSCASARRLSFRSTTDNPLLWICMRYGSRAPQKRTNQWALSSWSGRSVRCYFRQTPNIVVRSCKSSGKNWLFKTVNLHISRWNCWLKF